MFRANQIEGFQEVKNKRSEPKPGPGSIQRSGGLQALTIVDMANQFDTLCLVVCWASETPAPMRTDGHEGNERRHEKVLCGHRPPTVCCVDSQQYESWVGRAASHDIWSFPMQETVSTTSLDLC